MRYALLLSLLMSNSLISNAQDKEVDIEEKNYYNYEIDDYQTQAPPKSSNPFEEMAMDMAGFGFGGGDEMGLVGGNAIANTQNLELAMLQSVSDKKTIIAQDTLVKYDVIVDKKINSSFKFNLKGLWRIAFKEEFDNVHIVPFFQSAEQKICLNDTIIFANEYMYGPTTCLKNVLFYNTDIDKIIYTEAKDFDRSKDSFSTDMQNNLRYATYERFGIEKIPTIRLGGDAFGAVHYFDLHILNKDLIAYYFNYAIYYLERISFPPKSPLSLDSPLEVNANYLTWRKNPTEQGKMITGKDVSDLVLYLTDKEFNDSLISQGYKLKIFFYPPKTGSNNLVISNLNITNKGMVRSEGLYATANQKSFHNMTTITIPLHKLKSPLLFINFSSNLNKKYPWGLKYFVTRY